MANAANSADTPTINSPAAKTGFLPSRSPSQPLGTALMSVISTRNAATNCDTPCASMRSTPIATSGGATPISSAQPFTPICSTMNSVRNGMAALTPNSYSNLAPSSFIASRCVCHRSRRY